MTFLPIVERELRVAARRGGTFWLRVVAAVVALGIGACYLVVMTATPFAGSGLTVGGPLFGILTWLSLVVALSAGLFLTSDCLSEEKREGTLGFLFLTDLRGYDVVLGKLFATSLRSAFTLLALFPIFAMTFLLGGVGAAQFWKTMLALLNALFFSLATGMLVSSLSRNGQKALAGTVGLMAVWGFGGQVFDWIIEELSGRPSGPILNLCSPVKVFQSVNDWRGQFWQALVASQTVAWLQLALACVLVRRNWQDKTTKVAAEPGKWRSWWRRGGEKRRHALREKWLGRDPMLWLALRERGSLSSAWLWPALLVAGITVAAYQLADSKVWFLWSFLSGTVSLVVYLSIASQASQFFLEARRTRLVELLLAAPLDPYQIVMGPWRALVRLFGGLVVLLIVIQVCGTFFSLSLQQSRFGATMGLGYSENVALVLSRALIGALVTVANLAALAWFGLWMGMTSRNALLATFKTIVFVQVVPWFIMTIGTAMLVPLVLLPTLMNTGAASTSTAWFSTWYPLLSAALAGSLALGKDYLFWRWSRRKLLKDFREQATRVVAPIVVHKPVAGPPVPPIIRAAKP